MNLIRQTVIKSKFHREIGKEELDLNKMVIEGGLDLYICINSNGNLFNTFKEEDVAEFLRNKGVKKESIERFLEDKKINDNDSFLVVDSIKKAKSKDELRDFLKKTHGSKEVLKSKELKKEINELKEKENKRLKKRLKEEEIRFLENRRSGEIDRLSRFIDEFDDKYIYSVDFEFNTQSKKVTQAGIIKINLETGETERFNFIFSKKNFKYNPYNSHELSLTDPVEGMDKKEKMESIRDIFKDAGSVIIWGGREDRKILKAIGVDVERLKFVDVQKIIKKLFKSKVLSSLIDASKKQCGNNRGVYVNNKTSAEYNKFVKDFKERDNSKISKEGKEMFFNNIGLHSAINDAAATLFVFESVVSSINSKNSKFKDILKKSTDKIDESMRNFFIRRFGEKPTSKKSMKI